MGGEDLGVLRKSALLNTLTDDQLNELTQHITTRKFVANQILVRSGEDGDGLYVVSKGAVAVIASGGAQQSQATLDILGPGQMFGEMSLLDGQPRSATVKATDEAECLFLPRAAFADLLSKHPEAGVAMLPVLSQRLRQANQWVERLL